MYFNNKAYLILNLIIKVFYNGVKYPTLIQLHLTLNYTWLYSNFLNSISLALIIFYFSLEHLPIFNYTCHNIIIYNLDQANLRAVNPILSNRITQIIAMT